MADSSDDLAAEQTHRDAFIRENADQDIRRPAHCPTISPLDRLARGGASGLLSQYSPNAVTVRRSRVTITTRRTSFDFWAALASLETLLSDYRRIAPRYSFMQTAGDAGIAVGNEYRLTVSDPAVLAPLNAAIANLAPAPADPPRIDRRIMDVRAVRSGPWGGETGELVVEALRNHALAGASSLWVVAHDEADDGTLRVTLDSCEVARWAWAPDLLANRNDDGIGGRIMAWTCLFERLAQSLDGMPEETEPDASWSVSSSTVDIAQDVRVKDALKIHHGLKPFLDRMIPP